MKNKAVQLVIMTVLLLSNCILDEKDDNNSDLSIVEDYLPSPISGAVFKWHKETNNYITGTIDTMTYSENITGPVTISGHDYYTITKSNNFETKKFCIEINSIYFLIEENMFPIIGSNPDTPFGYNCKFFDFSVSQGSEYDILDWGTSTDEFVIYYHIKGTFVGYETIETQLSNFYDCPKFQIRHDTKITPNESAEIKNYSRLETYWFAKNIGIIKRVTENYDELNLFETTIEKLIE